MRAPHCVIKICKLPLYALAVAPNANLPTLNTAAPRHVAMVAGVCRAHFYLVPAVFFLGCKSQICKSVITWNAVNVIYNMLKWINSGCHKVNQTMDKITLAFKTRLDMSRRHLCSASVSLLVLAVTFVPDQHAILCVKGECKT